jgi:hypothetical protein
MVNNFMPVMVKDILMDPVKAWQTINSNKRPVITITLSFLLPLIIFVSAAAIAGSLLFTNSVSSPGFSVLMGIKCLLVLFITIYGSAYILTRITYQPELSNDFFTSFRLIAYSAVPFLLCQLLSCLFESLLFVNVLALYGLYIFWTGLEAIIIPPSRKKKPILIVTFVVFAGVYIASDLILTLMFNKIFG